MLYIKNRLLTQQVFDCLSNETFVQNNHYSYEKIVASEKSFYYKFHIELKLLYLYQQINPKIFRYLTLSMNYMNLETSRNWTFKNVLHEKYQSVKLYCKLINIMFNILSIFCQYFLSTKQNQSSQSYDVGLKMRADYKLHDLETLLFVQKMKELC